MEGHSLAAQDEPLLVQWNVSRICLSLGSLGGAFVFGLEHLPLYAEQ